jgi:uncharacterized membrane protein
MTISTVYRARFVFLFGLFTIVDCTLDQQFATLRLVVQEFGDCIYFDFPFYRSMMLTLFLYKNK